MRHLATRVVHARPTDTTDLAFVHTTPLTHSVIMVAKKPAAKKPAAKKPAAKKSASAKKPAAKRATAVKKTTATKKKKPAAKKKKKKPAAKKAKKPAANAAPKKEYDLHGQKRDTPDEADPLRKFYLSLRKQNPKSVMAEVWLMEHGLLEDAEAQRDAYKRFLKSKGKAVPKLTIKKVKTEVKEETETPAAMKPAATKVVVDDDSDDDVPLAQLAAKS